MSINILSNIHIQKPMRKTDAHWVYSLLQFICFNSQLWFYQSQTFYFIASSSHREEGVWKNSVSDAISRWRGKELGRQNLEKNLGIDQALSNCLALSFSSRKLFSHPFLVDHQKLGVYNTNIFHCFISILSRTIPPLFICWEIVDQVKIAVPICEEKNWHNIRN